MATKIQIPDLKHVTTHLTDDLLSRQTGSRRASTSGPLPAIARLAIVLEILLGIGALFGGGQFMLAPDGHLIGVPLKMLAGTPFHSFLVPGSFSSPFSAWLQSWRPRSRPADRPSVHSPPSRWAWR